MTERTSTAIVRPLEIKPVACLSPALYDEVETTSSDPTTLQFSAEQGRFIYTWQTPRQHANVCYTVTLSTIDGSSLSAFFRLK